MEISFILGAGFSRNADLPVVAGVSEKFLQKPLADHTLNFYSGEWKWRDWANDAERHNGILPFQHEPVSLIIEVMARHFLKQKQTVLLNYEEFFQFMVDMAGRDKERFTAIVEEAQQEYDSRHKFSDFKFNSVPKSEILSCFYHLIDDLLWVRKPYEEIEKMYSPYIEYFFRDDHRFNIFTLNHDLLLEKIFYKTGLPYSDGFSTVNTHLFDDKNNPLPVYDGSFKQRLSLMKLHGSIDIYKYRYIEKTNEHYGFDYFKTMDFHAKHTANHIENNVVLQNWTPEITPKFITGQNKKQIISEDKMYGDLYHRLESILPQSDRLIVVGYSFMDEHINDVIKKSLPTIKDVININPGQKFKFEHPNITEINPLNEKLYF